MINLLPSKSDYINHRALATIPHYLCKIQRKFAFTQNVAVHVKLVIYLFLSIWLAFDILPIRAAENPFKPNWLTVSDRVELERTWTSALVLLPEKIGKKRGTLLEDEELLNSLISNEIGDAKLPLILFLHACEGLGHHRDDLEKYSKLGFAVIALDSFAREHRPFGCYEDQARYIKYYDIAVAFRKAELDYAVKRINRLSWVDNNNLFLIGSGIGGMVVAHYQGAEFAGHVIEGWGCHHPHKVFNGIWTPRQVRIFSVVSKHDEWYVENPGFSGNCAEFLQDRPDSVSVTADRIGHYSSWHPKSRPSLIKFLTRNLDVNQDVLIEDTPIVVDTHEQGITLKIRWSLEAVYSAASKYCSQQGKVSHIVGNNPQDVYTFVCS